MKTANWFATRFESRARQFHCTPSALTDVSIRFDLEVLPIADALSICSFVPNQCRSRRETHRESSKETCVDFSSRRSVSSLVSYLKCSFARLLPFLCSHPPPCAFVPF